MNLDEQKITNAIEDAKNILQTKENKAEAITEAINLILEAKYSNLISEIKAESIKAESDSEYAKSLNLRVLNKKEKDFYSKFKNLQQSLSVNQNDIIPTTIIDYTLEEVKTDSELFELIDFAPANVKKWLVADKTGKAAWGKLFDSITSEISAEINGLNIELGKLSAYLLIPKAISDLAEPFVDKYFRAIMKEVLILGAEDGYLNGNGKESPIGIYKKIDSVNEDGTHKDKDVNANITSFSPKSLAPAKVSLTKTGKRKLGTLYLVCNPSDRANYVDPALYDAEGNMKSSYKDLKVIESTENPLGKAAFTLKKKYTMGFSGFTLSEYKETKALDDVDVLIAKAYGNGRAVDDNVAYIFDVTKLVEYIPTVKSIVAGEVTTTVAGEVTTKTESGIEGA